VAAAYVPSARFFWIVTSPEDAAHSDFEIVSAPLVFGVEPADMMLYVPGAKARLFASLLMPHAKTASSTVNGADAGVSGFGVPGAEVAGAEVPGAEALGADPLGAITASVAVASGVVGAGAPAEGSAADGSAAEGSAADGSAAEGSAGEGSAGSGVPEAGEGVEVELDGAFGESAVGTIGTVGAEASDPAPAGEPEPEASCAVSSRTPEVKLAAPAESSLASTGSAPKATIAPAAILAMAPAATTRAVVRRASAPTRRIRCRSSGRA
jgi:hypothetical protein